MIEETTKSAHFVLSIDFYSDCLNTSKEKWAEVHHKMSTLPDALPVVRSLVVAVSFSAGTELARLLITGEGIAKHLL
jgi:hypothetical protein